MTEPRLLIVDDEPQLIRVLLPSFAAAGYVVETAINGADAIKAIAGREPFDAVVLDLGLPDMDGKQVIAHVRKSSPVPIIVLSARDAEQEKIDALDAGANDFVNKPFRIGELMARLRAALRQNRAQVRSMERFAHLEVDFDGRRMRVAGRAARPSPRELKLLRVFMERPNEVLTHKQIVSAVWGAGQEVETQFVRVLVANLRQKVELDPARPQLIITEPGIGYRLQTPEPDQP